jgi:hypothetical protein
VTGHSPAGFSPLRLWTLHPWRVWWASLVFLYFGTLLDHSMPRTSSICFGVGAILGAASFVQGLRVSWRRSPLRAVLIVLSAYALSLFFPVLKARSAQGYDALGKQAITLLIGLGVLAALAVIVECLVRILRRARAKN